jgi:hypothetical protein
MFRRTAWALRAWLPLLVVGLAALPATGWSSPGDQKDEKGRRNDPANEMSPMGRAAVKAAARAAVAAVVSTGAPVVAGAARECVNGPDCEGEDDGEVQDDAEGPARTQAELSIAVDSTGQHIVVGFNDFRGFLSNPISVSGFMYSDNGGLTFVDGGQLPTPGNETIGTTRFPQVFGDPDIKYLGACNFVYSSILVKKFSSTRAVQTMGVHRSTDCGHTWSGPYEVTPATNPHGAVSSTTGAPRDAADKEFMSVDPETGRVLMSWSNFTPFAAGGVEISTTSSDDLLTATPPTWSARKIVAATSADGQGSVPRFAGNGSSNAYIAWARFPFPGTLLGYGNNVGFARSTDNGATWSAPVDLTSEFLTMDLVLGNDRVNTFPSLAVDNSGGTYRGSIYVVYSNNNSGDGADIAFQKSTDEGVTFSAPIVLDSRPAADRAQWFPWVTVDRDTGRVIVFYYDQGIADNGQRTEVTYTFSDDGGAHWSAPLPLTSRPFKAGWGNDTGQPNLGDYNQAVAQGGDFFVTYAASTRPPLGFTDGQPDSSMTVPDVVFRRVTPVSEPADEDEEDEGVGGPAPVNLGAVTFTDSGGNGNIDPGDRINLRLTLRNYVTNPLNAAAVSGIQGRLSTTTPGVTVLSDHSPYPNLNPGASAANKKDFVLQIAPTFVPGTDIELTLTVRSADNAPATLLHTLFTGTPRPTTIFSEAFDGVPPGTLPGGWSTFHQGGANTVPWTTSNTFCGTGSNAAFHQNANDGPPGGSPRRFERLFSPLIDVPANASYVTLEFDVCYNTEDDPVLKVLAYDGFTLRITDQTTGRTLRSVLVEAFEDEFTTGSFEHFPKHFPRSSNPAYFEDMSAWAGDSGGVKHVRMRLPGMAGSRVQLRFEYTQDGFGTCVDVRPGTQCGVSVDNIVMKSVESVVP